VTVEGATPSGEWQYVDLDSLPADSAVVVHATVTGAETNHIESGAIFAYVVSTQAFLMGLNPPADGNIYRTFVSNGNATLRFPVPGNLSHGGEHKLRVGYDGGTKYSSAYTTIFITSK
jgi:hypothetical protein